MYKLIFCVVLLNCLLSINSKLINKEVERVIDLSSQLVKITATITIENTGKIAESHFLIYLEPEVFSNLSYVSVQDTQKHELDVTKDELNNEIAPRNVFNVRLPELLATDRAITIRLEKVFTSLVISVPTRISQRKKQLVRFYGSYYFYSPYATLKQTTAVIVNSRKITSYSKLTPVSQTNLTIHYGPYSNVLPLTVDPMVIHFESKTPILTGNRLDGFSQEDVAMLHTWPKPNGYSYQSDANSKHHNIIKTYRTVLPASAHNLIYYSGINENISTSQICLHKDWIELELRPRCQLFSGWNAPSYEYLYKNHYFIRMRLIDNLETNVALPIQTTDIILRTPYGVERLQDSFFYNYLAFKTQSTIKFHRSNLLVEDFKITYSWRSISICLLYQTGILCVFIALLFAAVIAYGKFDFFLSQNEKKLE